jgi:hypothetical protein
MKRWSCAVALGVLLALAVAGPASAKYNDPTTTTTTTSAPSSSTTSSTTTTTAPAPPRAEATTTVGSPAAGDAVPISAPSSGGEAAIDATKPVAAVMVPGNGDAPGVPMPAPKVTQHADGTVTVEVTVPPNTPPGVYVIAVVGSTPSGKSRVIIVPVVVRPTEKTTAQGLSAASAPTVPVAVPAEARKVAASVAQAGGEAAVVDAVLHDGAKLEIRNDQLVVFHPGDDSTTDGSRPLVAAFAVALAGGGLVLLRRRTPAISKRSR